MPRNVQWLLGGTKLWQGGFVFVSLPVFPSQVAQCAKGLLPVPPQAPGCRLLHPPFTPRVREPWVGGSVGGQGRFVRGDSSCDRH